MKSEPVTDTVVAETIAVATAKPSSRAERFRARPVAHGKFLYSGGEKLWIRGVTYGTFRPNQDGDQYPSPSVVASDFERMRANGINAVRTYTVPPRWLLDTALANDLWVMVGQGWPQNTTFLDDKARVRSIERQFREGVRLCARHPALLCYTLGNEIPASIVRWHGRRRIERFIQRLYDVAKEEDAEGLATYVNFPSTEYLDLPFLDFVSFNVYLETRERYESYLARLQNLADERPLVMAEIGLDSRSQGELTQARCLDWQIRSAFTAGCAGTFLFAWTDEWHTGGHDIESWDFGLTTRERRAKSSLHVVRRAYSELLTRDDLKCPRISVIVCSYNGARTIRDTLEGLARLNYPDFEVIVVNDGSVDATPDIAAEYDVRLISTENRGLASARNTGLDAASGEIVAYIDDDAYPDPDWLRYLALTYGSTEHAGVGGPNLAPPGDGPIADCVANSPGGPVHVLLADTVAEHIPGCNMSFRKSALEAVGGFDPRYRAAGDDVDICWAIMERGGTIGFHPAAMVWHHRRGSVRNYWKQQLGYGKAEALLEEKWPEKYNGLGHIRWGGRLYGKGLTTGLGILGERIYHGVWGSAPFQSLYQSAPTTWRSIPLTPEWYLLVASLAGLSLAGLLWSPLLNVTYLALLAAAFPLAQAFSSAGRARFNSHPKTLWQRSKVYSITFLLHLAQPLARLLGRLRHGLTPWRMRGTSVLGIPWPRRLTLWRESWEAPATTLERIQSTLDEFGAVVPHGGCFDHWDLEVRGGLLGAARLRMAVEEHGMGRQQVRFRIWLRGTVPALWIAGFLALVGSMLTVANDPLAVIPWSLCLIGGGRLLYECSAALGLGCRALERLGAKPER